MPSNVEYLEILYEALGTRFGLVVETEDAERLRQRFYSLRKECDDFAPLSFLISPINGKDLWVLKRMTADATD